MKGRKPASDNVVPLTGDQARGDFTAFSRDRADALRPEGLPFEVRAVWDRIAPPLCDPRRDRLDESNVFMFEQLCWSIARHEKLRVDIADNGETYSSETRNGTQFKSRPEVAQLNETWRQIRSLSSDFGMTPSAERGLKVAGQLGFGFEDDFD